MFERLLADPASPGACCSRLGFLNALALTTYGAQAVPGAAPQPVPSMPAGRTRVVLLGTAGGPSLRPGRSSPASAVVVDDVVYLVDCGYGVGRQLVAAHLGVLATRAIFISHHHSPFARTQSGSNAAAARAYHCSAHRCCGRRTHRGCGQCEAPCPLASRSRLRSNVDGSKLE